MPERATTPGTPIAELALVGGHRCLDFINTLVGADETAPRDSLLTPADYRTWAKRVAISVDQPAAAADEAAALDRARALREAILAIALAAVAGRPVPADAAEYLTEATALSFRSRRLRPGPGGLAWARTRQDLDSVTDLLAVETAALLAD